MSPDASDSSPLAVILRSVTEAILITDPQGRVTLINSVAERLFDVRAAEALGQPLTRLHAPLGEWLDRALADSTAQPFVFNLDIGAGRFYSAVFSGLAGEDSQRQGWVLVLQEVTHLKKVEEWKAEAIQAATHDLRNPLNLMNGAVNLLRDSLKEPTPEQRECLTMIRSGLDRMGGLVEQLLNLDQVEGRSDLNLVGVELRRIVQLVSDEFRLAADEKGVTLAFASPPAGGRVLGDESWLHRAVANLVNNALKYTPRGGQVQVRYQEADNQAICEVIDTGPGIPSPAQARLFERFYRVPGEATRRNPGTGLGLAIVKTIIERHSGRVWVSSQEGVGSTFGFSVPLAPA